MKKLFNKSTLFLLVILGTFAYSCEYESVDLSPDCSVENFNFSIDQAASVLAIECGTSNGEIVLSVADSIADDLSFSFNEGDFNQTTSFSQLGAGNYTIVAKNEITGCTSDTLLINIENENGFSISLNNKKNSSCGANEGLIDITQIEGIEPIEFKINNKPFQSESIFTNLSPGNYDITARDANGCEVMISDIKITSGVSLANDITSIINTNCAVTGCHNGSQPPNLSNTDNIISSASRIKSRTSSGSMPPSGREDLTQEEIDLIACWVDDGALNN